ncbi:MAG: SGNH/GDSL hydrolase family protein [Lachnospiraceae bacterium]|nr:SGNH/GDSL hydrolase family protein [Lachnospiraceae bacterium]
MEKRSDAVNIRRKSSPSKKKRVKKDEKKALNILFILLFYLFPIAALIIPYLVFRSGFSPVLTKDFVDELAFVKYLVAHNSHDFAEGWISTKPFIPFSTRYFLTYYFTDFATWQDALLKSVTAVYAIFCAAYIFFVTSLHAKKFYTYIIASLPAIPLSIIGLNAVYDVNYILTVFIPVLICLGLLIHGIRFKVPVPFKIAISLLAVIPVILIGLYMHDIKKEQSFDNSNLLSLNLSAKKEAVDITNDYKPLIDFLDANGIKLAYCTDTVINEIAVVGNEKVEIAPVVSPEDLTKVEIKEDSLPTPYEKVSREAKPFYMIYDSDTVKKYSSSLALKFGDNIYSDAGYSVYSYKNFDYFDDRIFQNNMVRLASEKYDSFYYSFLGSSIEDAGDFGKFFGTTPIFITPSDIEYEDTNVLLDMAVSKNGLKYAFFEIDPLTFVKEDGKAEFEYFNKMIEKYPDISFYAILSYPHVSYWKNLSEDETKKAFGDYESCIKTLTHNDNLHLYWPGNVKWLIESPANYNDGIPVSDVAANLLILTTCNLKYSVDKNSFAGETESLLEIVKEDVQYPDLSDKEIVFFGDSIMGNYHGPVSIPGEAGGLSGANTFNLGVGGTSAIADFNRFVDAFLGSASLSDIEDKDFLSELERFEEEHDESKELYFIINYGVNDYFMGVPAHVNTGSPYGDYDYDSYEASMTDGLIKLKSSYPDAKICILSPIYTNFFEAGERIMSEVGSPLQTYRDMGRFISEKLNTEWIDSLNIIEINEDNYETYLLDEVHPNQDGLYLISDSIIRFIAGEKKEKEDEKKD